MHLLRNDRGTWGEGGGGEREGGGGRGGEREGGRGRGREEGRGKDVSKHHPNNMAD